jgi:hypothetical protein
MFLEQRNSKLTVSDSNNHSKIRVDENTYVFDNGVVAGKLLDKFADTLSNSEGYNSHHYETDNKPGRASNFKRCSIIAEYTCSDYAADNNELRRQLAAKVVLRYTRK